MFDFFDGNELMEMMPFAALYAETHYRFRYFPFSLYYRKQPEIIFDCPLRLEPGKELPILLMIKNADKFPVEVKTISIQVSQNNQIVEKKIVINAKIDSPFWYRIYYIDTADLPPTELSVNCKIEVICNKKLVVINNDNHPGLSHAPFSVLKAEYPLPLLPEWSAGELHCHTSFGTDQVEFGAPPDYYQRAAEAMGLSWVALTDHAYNLDDLPDNYLINDPKQEKWAMFLSEVDRANKENQKVILLPGEELTCRSATGKNIHLLMIGQRSFLIGTGDDAQNWYNTRSEHTVSQAISKIDPNAVAIAAHPLTPISFLEKLLVNRDAWNSNDLNESGLTGWQIWNGQLDTGFHTGMNLWEKALLQGKRAYIYAGNDAHGNFNRFRQISLPMVSMRENSKHLFGKATTRLKTGGSVTNENILNALRQGKCTLSNGPALDMRIVSNYGTSEIGSETKLDKDAEVQIEYLTTPEFGELKEIKLFGGSHNEEIVQEVFDSESEPEPQKWAGKLARPLLGNDYLRAELITEHKTGSLFHSFTNPIWLKK